MSKRPSEPADLPSDVILAIVQEIHDSGLAPKNRKREFEKKYAEFAERYPKLFQGACSDVLDISQLKQMLQLRERVQNNSISLYDASAVVGQKMFDKYVKPVVDKLDNEHK